jgi:hypothetical protein
MTNFFTKDTLKKLGPAVVTVRDCCAEILQNSSGISKSRSDSIDLLCLVEFFISSSASSADERIVGGRLGAHVDN